MSALVIGVDPGLTTGLLAARYDVELRLHGEPIAMQIHGSEGVIPMVQTLVTRAAGAEVLIAVEQFVVSGRAARSSSAHAGRITRALIAELHDMEQPLFLRNASLVKTWATDKRLNAAGLLAPTVGMNHARDAARHALYAAVHTGIASDPLSPRKAAAR